MSQKITYTRTVTGSTVYTLTFANNKYLELRHDYEGDEKETRSVFKGDMNRKMRGYYVKAAISYSGIKNQDLTALRNLFTVGTTNILYYPDSNSAECYPMDLPKNFSTTDFLETWQEGFEVELRSKKRYENPIPHDVGYIGCRKIDLTYHIRLNGSET